jgi:DNA-binding TFAR19-related protein (PDSD5 family)
MSGVDDELERLKRRRMRELQRQLHVSEGKPEVEQEKPREPTRDEVLGRFLVGRAWEVLEAGRAQFPKVMPQVEEALVEAFKVGKIKESIDGGMLLQFLRQVGLPVRVHTSIRYKEHGELKTIGQRIREK